MKKIFLALTCLTIIISLLPALSGAVGAAPGDIIPICEAGNSSGTDGSETAVCQDVNNQDGATNPIIGIIKSAVRIVSYITGAAAIILIILSSIRFIASGGDSGKISQAKGALIYALVGIVITALAQVIISFVLNKV